MSSLSFSLKHDGVIKWKHVPSHGPFIRRIHRSSVNSHIRHSRAGRALLRWRKECGRIWVQLASAAQAPIHSVAYMYTASYQFLPVTSSVIVTCTYPFTADDNHLQKSTIMSSAMSLYRSPGHDINPSFTDFVQKMTKKSHRTFAFITLEGPEDRHLRNSSFGGHVTSLTLQYLWPRPPGV